MGQCLHCRWRKACSGRGLCRACFNDRTVRYLYRAIRETRPDRRADPTHDMTMAELDALIAEQRKCLPDWWEEESRRMRVYGVEI